MLLINCICDLLSSSLVDVLDLTGLSPSVVVVVFFPYGFCTLLVEEGGDDREGDNLEESRVLEDK